MLLTIYPEKSICLIYNIFYNSGHQSECEIQFDPLITVNIIPEISTLKNTTDSIISSNYTKYLLPNYIINTKLGIFSYLKINYTNLIDFNIKEKNFMVFNKNTS